jgi:hypothetical protein
MPSILRLMLLVVVAGSASAQVRITTPREQFGANIGDDYFLFNYKQMEEYWRKLDAQSDRIVVREIGKTSEGRAHLMAIVTSPANHRTLERYRTISRRLALAEGLTARRARSRRKAKPSSGSMAGCMPTKFSVRSSSVRWSIRW